MRTAIPLLFLSFLVDLVALEPPELVFYEPLDVDLLHDGDSRYFLRIHGGWILAANELNDDRYAPTRSGCAWRVGLRNGWEFRGRHGGSPVAFVLTIDTSYERRAMFGAIDGRPAETNPWGEREAMYGPPLWWGSPEGEALYLAHELTAPHRERLKRQRRDHHLNAFGADLGLGIRGFVGPGDLVIIEGRTFAGPSLGTLGASRYYDVRLGASVGVALQPVSFLRLGVEVGASQRFGRAREWDTKYRGSALELSGAVEFAF